MKLPDLIFVSLDNWDDTWGRNQFICSILAQHHPQSRILFVGLPRDFSHDLRCGRLGAAAGDLLGQGASPSTAKAPPNVTFLNPLKILPDRWRTSLAINQTIFRSSIRNAARRLGMSRPILWINAHQAAHLAGTLNESALIYDVTDDWTAFPQPARVLQRTIHQDQTLCRRADAVIVCSNKLFEIKSNLVGGSLHLVANGVHPEHYDVVMDGIGELPPAAWAWPQPVFGYTGTVHPHRVDVQLVRDVASQMQSGSLVFIGPNHLPKSDRRSLAQTNRVIFHGPASYESLPQLMRGFDVCMVPHLTTPFVQSLQPIKLWEYLAAGKPIVSTDVAGFRDYPQLVRIAANPRQFFAQLQEATKEYPDLSPRRRAEARINSWSKRVDQIETVLGQAAGIRIESSSATAPAALAWRTT